MSLTAKDRLQVAAFHSIYRMLRRSDAEFRRSREEDFVKAIVMTSDEALRDADPVLIEKWLTEYGEKKSRRQGFYEVDIDELDQSQQEETLPCL